MDNKKHTEQQVELALNSLDAISRAKPTPFLYTRVIAKLNNEEKGVISKLVLLLSKPAVAFAMVLVVLLCNSVVVYNRSQVAVTTVSTKDMAVADEYNPSVGASLYNYENDNAK